MCEAGNPLAFYKNSGGVEFGTTEKKKKYVPTISQDET